MTAYSFGFALWLFFLPFLCCLLFLVVLAAGGSGIGREDGFFDVCGCRHEFGW